MKKVLIIGSGIGGLTLGNLLAQKGHSVTIFESHGMPGGYTAGFHRHGFYFESGTLSLEASASVFKAMRDIGVLDKVEFVTQRLRFVWKNQDRIPESYAEYKQMFYSAFPAEQDRLNKYFAEIDRLVAAMGNTNKPMPYFYNGWAAFLAVLPYIFKGPKLMKLMKQYQGITSSEFLERYFEKDSEVYRLMNGFGYPDMAAFYLMGVAGMITDYWTVKNGMQFWADILADRFRQSGGELKLNSYVDRIVTQNGAAVGIYCKNTYYEADCVFSASDYKKTLLQLLDNQTLIPEEFQQKLSRAPVSESFFTVYLGLKLSNDELRKSMRVPHVMFNDSQPGCDIYDSKDEAFFDKTALTLYAPSLVNPSHAPDGKSSLMIQTFVPYRWLDNWGGGNQERYRQLKEKAMKTLIVKAAKFIPGLEAAIEFQDAATPLTYERYTHNSDGASSSWSWNPKKSFFGGDMDVHVDTPVGNLYISSCWASANGGIPGALMAAYVCAKKVK
jgi:phytoene dehydrogenase-like protein